MKRHRSQKRQRNSRPLAPRRLRTEHLEPRQLLTADAGMPSLFEPGDVNRDGYLSSLDALVVINSLNRPSQLHEAFDPAMDVNQDGKLSALDVLWIINRLNSDGTGNDAVGVDDSTDDSSGPSIPRMTTETESAGITSEETFTIDNTAPTVAISRQTPSAEVTNADSVTFLLEFSEDVINVTADDFEVAASGVTTGEITIGDNGDSDESTYTVSIASIRGDGVLDLDFAPSQDITDKAGNPFSPQSEDPASSIRGQAYTELIAVTINPAAGSITTEVWGTQGTDTSPEAAALIDLEAAAQQLGATRVILNGPRYLLADAGTLTPGAAPIQTFGDLEMQLIGSIELDLASPPTSLQGTPYVPRTVSRNTDSIYYAGSEIYQLTSPAGEMYVMQSTVTELENADLAGLGDRLTLPEGWVFEVITLEEPLRVTVSGGDTIDVLMDDLGNAYGYVGIVTPVASLTANPNPATTGSNITLTATPVVTATQVVFFRESNGTPGLQSTDTPVGADNNGADGWTASVNVGTPGSFTYYAVPLVANSPVGTPMATTVIVQGGVETAIPNEPADQVYTTADGVEFVRTPDEQFENLPDWPYEPKYVEIDGLRQAYIDEGPEDGPVVLLLHGQPSWSYLYRDMIPVLVDAGYRVIAMDHLGMGRSDKPTDVDYYTYEVHTDRLEQFIVELGLENINLFAQDWGSLIGLHVAGENPEWFASIAIGNGTLPVIPAGTQPFPPVVDTDAIVDVPSPFTLMPAQQVPFRDADGELIGQGPAGAFGDAYFGNWMNFAMTGASFKPSDVLEALTWFDIPADEQAAYDAPFPSRAYLAGARSFPSVINDLPGANDQAWAGLGTYDKPFVTIWGGNDPGNLGGSEVQQQLIDHVPGADGQPHTRLPEASHFLQDDQGEEIATQLVAFYQANGIEGVGNDDGSDNGATILTTEAGVQFVRTPDEQFESLPDWPYEPMYVEIDGLRQAYIDEGPADGPVVLLLHGQPSWSYLYRDMIPVLADAGYRVIAMDHLGMGRSDKPIDIESYSFLNHTYRLEQFIQELGLEDINLFAQDWGSIIGLHVAGLNPDCFATISIGNGSLPMFPAGAQPFPDVEDPDAIVPLPSPFAMFPDQQVPFYDAEGNLLLERQDNSYFGRWINYAMTGESFHASEVLEALTWFPLTAEEEAAYDAPFPSRIYMAGTRAFPSLVNDLPGVNQASFAGLQSYENPFLTIWGANDPGAAGSVEAQQFLINSVPGAQGQPHTRLPEASHFLQDDQGEEIATQLVAFYQANGIEGVDPVEEDQTRYIDSIFETTISEDIVYATVDGQELLLNVITPQGDTETDRPLIIIANGGAFAFTDREQIIPVAEQFAEAGYVAVVMSYRTQGGMTSGEDFRYAALDATHDMIAAVRFMKANAETFGIDPNKVIVGGASAGAIMAASVGTTDPDDPVSDELAAYLETVGGVYGNVGEHLDQSPAVQGVFAISGAIFGLDTIDANSAPIYAVHNELDPVAPCGSVGGSGSGISVSGTCDFIPAFQAAGVPAQSFIVPGDTGHVQYSQEEWQQFTAEALEFFFTHVVNETGEEVPGTDAEILSANIGVLDIPFPQPLANITGVEQRAGDDGIPMVFSVPIDATTLSADDFLITTASGATTRPTVATLEPAPESDESTTVLLAGPLGSFDDLPVSVEIVGSVKSVDGEELQGLTSEITMDGSELVVAFVDPAETNVAGNETTPTRIQLTFNGGVTGPSNAELGVEELLAFRIIDEDGNSHIPTGFEDLGDNDNYVVLLVPPGVTPASVTVQSNTLFSPTNQPNAASSIEISGTIELNDDEHEELAMGRPQLELSLRRMLLTRRIVAQVHEAVGAHGPANLLPVRMMSGVRGSTNLIDRATRLAPALVDAALQSDAFDDSAELLLSRLATQRIPEGLRGALGRLRR